MNGRRFVQCLITVGAFLSLTPGMARAQDYTWGGTTVPTANDSVEAGVMLNCSASISWASAATPVGSFKIEVFDVDGMGEPMGDSQCTSSLNASFDLANRKASFTGTYTISSLFSGNAIVVITARDATFGELSTKQFAITVTAP